jgi:hypothetical protein
MAYFMAQAKGSGDIDRLSSTELSIDARQIIR